MNGRGNRPKPTCHPHPTLGWFNAPIAPGSLTDGLHRRTGRVVRLVTDLHQHRVAYNAGILLGLLYRIKIEERVLFDGFGEEYGRYMRDTSRLIPRVW